MLNAGCLLTAAQHRFLPPPSRVYCVNYLHRAENVLRSSEQLRPPLSTILSHMNPIHKLFLLRIILILT